MRMMGISEFKAKCIAVIRAVQRVRAPTTVTRRGVPLVRIEPLVGGRSRRRLGALRDDTAIRGEIVRTDFPDEWETEA